jgi:uncharacterized protein YcbK (DUF882 family)
MLVIAGYTSTCELPRYDHYDAKLENYVLQPYDSSYSSLGYFSGLLQVKPGSKIPDNLNLAAIPVPIEKPKYTPPKPRKSASKNKSKPKKKPNKTISKEASDNLVLSFVQPAREGLSALLRGNDGDNETTKNPVKKPKKKSSNSENYRGKVRLIKSDGNEIVDCFRKHKQLWNALKLIDRKYGPIIVESGYRSRAYNDNLRRKGRGAAKNSLHIQCRAADIRAKRASVTQLARYAKQLQREGKIGGVGIYRSWVHIDNGRTRSW